MVKYLNHKLINKTCYELKNKIPREFLHSAIEKIYIQLLVQVEQYKEKQIILRPTILAQISNILRHF